MPRSRIGCSTSLGSLFVVVLLSACTASSAYAGIPKSPLATIGLTESPPMADVQNPTALIVLDKIWRALDKP